MTNLSMTKLSITIQSITKVSITKLSILLIVIYAFIFADCRVIIVIQSVFNLNVFMMSVAAPNLMTDGIKPFKAIIYFI